MDKDKDAVERGLERLLVEEQERADIEMRAGMADARLARKVYALSLGGADAHVASSRRLPGEARL